MPRVAIVTISVCSWGAYKLYIDAQGSASSGIAQVLINGVANSPATSFNSSAAILTYEHMPPASGLALESVTSNILTASTAVNISIIFASAIGEPRTHLPADDAARLYQHLR